MDENVHCHSFTIMPSMRVTIGWLFPCPPFMSMLRQLSQGPLQI